MRNFQRNHQSFPERRVPCDGTHLLPKRISPAFSEAALTITVARRLLSGVHWPGFNSSWGVLVGYIAHSPFYWLKPCVIKGISILLITRARFTFSCGCYRACSSDSCFPDACSPDTHPVARLLARLYKIRKGESSCSASDQLKNASTTPCTGITRHLQP